MATQRFSYQGFEFEFEDNSGEILAAFENAVKRGLKAIGGEAVKFAQEELRTPKPVFPDKVQDAIDSSKLIQTVYHKVVEDEVYVGTDTKQGTFVEYGTGRYSTRGGSTDKPSWAYQGKDGKWHRGFPMMARPFIKPAASEHTEEYREILLDSLENA